MGTAVIVCVLESPAVVCVGVRWSFSDRILVIVFRSVDWTMSSLLDRIMVCSGCGASAVNGIDDSLSSLMSCVFIGTMASCVLTLTREMATDGLGGTSGFKIVESSARPTKRPKSGEVGDFCFFSWVVTTDSFFLMFVVVFFLRIVASRLSSARGWTLPLLCIWSRKMLPFGMVAVVAGLASNVADECAISAAIIDIAFSCEFGEFFSRSRIFDLIAGETLPRFRFRSADECCDDASLIWLIERFTPDFASYDCCCCCGVWDEFVVNKSFSYVKLLSKLSQNDMSKQSPLSSSIKSFSWFICTE